MGIHFDIVPPQIGLFTGDILSNLDSPLCKDFPPLMLVLERLALCGVRTSSTIHIDRLIAHQSIALHFSLPSTMFSMYPLFLLPSRATCEYSTNTINFLSIYTLQTHVCDITKLKA